MMKKTLSLLLLSLGAIYTQASHINPADTLALNEVTVTAIKQGTNLKNQAISATEIGHSAIERNSVVSGRLAADMVPNLFMPDYGSRMTSTIYVRGLGTRIDQPAIGLNIDNIPIICKENFDFDLFDINKVEMLRGPQCTLFGRNAMAGVMNIHTASPLSLASGTSKINIATSYGNHNTRRVGASYLTKLGNNFGMSLTGQYYATDGEFTNAYNQRKCDWEENFAGRLKLEWMPRSDFYLGNTFIVNVSHQGGYPYEMIETGKIAYNDTCFYRRTALLNGLTLKKEWEKFSLNSITSYQYINDNMTLDQDFTEQAYFTLTQKRKEHALTHDLVLRSRNDDRYSWLVGAFGFYRHYDMLPPVTFKDYGIKQLIEAPANEKAPITLQWNDREFVLDSNIKSNNWGFAFYHQSCYEMGDFTLTGGLRLDFEQVGLKYRNETHTSYTATLKANGREFPGKIDIEDADTLSMYFAQVLPKLSLTYHIGGSQHNTVFAAISKGYKSGGYNTQMFSDMLQQKLMSAVGQGTQYDAADILSYKPEVAWNYEVGAHLETANRQLRANLSVFYMDCRDRQLTVFPDGKTTGRLMTNAGKTRSCGAEAALSYQPNEYSGINVSYGYTHAKFIEYDDGKANYKNNTVPYSPSHTLFAEAFHSCKVNRALLDKITFSANVKGTGSIYWDEANEVRQPFYALLGAAVNFQKSLNGGNIGIELWGRNLTNTSYNTFYFVSIGHGFLQRGRGTSFGATLRLTL